MNSYANKDNSSAQLKNYYDMNEKVSTPTQEALKKRRKKQAEKYGIDQEEEKPENV